MCYAAAGMEVNLFSQGLQQHQIQTQKVDSITFCTPGPFSIKIERKPMALFDKGRSLN